MLKPGGRVVIVDINFTRAYADELGKHGVPATVRGLGPLVPVRRPARSPRGLVSGTKLTRVAQTSRSMRSGDSSRSLTATRKHGLAAVDHAVIVAERDVHHRPDHHGVADHDRRA